MSVILVYEDDLHLQELLVQVVRKEFTVCIGKDPQQMQEEVNEVGPALILLDNMMEADVAKEVLADYRAETPSPIPVVLFTAHANGASIAEYIGADDYIAKPFQLLDLRKKLRELAKKGQ
ncbi:response regulator transcription factor [Telluribacter sp. SYSU D00476]|uniref:response regulator transcription factor n=1 Tax=Telluribacter sp. SYSU D00476 TaxID=2811430 RepID=UPI001FF27B2C|nr:response regulator [Telluribacter sp. SYSU D00476]